MKKLTHYLLSLTCLALLATGNVSAQQNVATFKKSLIGTWDLVADSNTAPDGVKTTGKGYGENPIGRWIFTADGQYFNINTRSTIAKFASGNRMTGT